MLIVSLFLSLSALSIKHAATKHLETLPQSYCMSLRSGNCVLMLHWIRWRLRVRGATWVDSMEEKAACLWLREGGGWQQCMEIGGASTGGIANVNLKMGTINNSYKSFLLVKAPVSPERYQLISYLPVYNVTEQPQPLLNAVDGLSHSATLKPVVVFVLPLCEQTAALARAAPLPLRAQGGWRGTWTREKS